MEGVRDIEWMFGFDRGLARARDLRRPVVLKPLGQGMGFCDDW